MTHFILQCLMFVVWLAVAPAVFIWTLRHWVKSSPKVMEPSWRSYTAIAAITLVGFSILLWIGAQIWAWVIGGFPFYDPVLLSFYRWGALTSLAGLLASLGGNGKLRWPSFGLSILMMFSWLAAATGE